MGIDTTYIKIAGYAASVALIGAGIGSLVRSGTLKQAAEAAVAETKALRQTLSQSTETIAKDFRSYLGTKNITLVQGSPISSTMKADSMKNVFERVVRASDENTKLHILVRGEKTQQSVSAKKLFDDFLKIDENYQNKLETYKNAYKAVNNEEQKLRELESHNLAEKFKASSKSWKIAGVAMCIAGAIIAVGSAALTIYDTYKYYHQDYAPIPRKIVHESSDDKGRSVYTVYDCTLCNRASNDDFKNDKLSGLYIFAATDNTKTDDKPAEKPDSSAADSSATDSSSKADDSSSTAENPATASAIGAGTLTLSCVGSAAVGALIAFLIVRKKKDDAA